jgi:hypothetical protein
MCDLSMLGLEHYLLSEMEIHLKNIVSCFNINNAMFTYKFIVFKLAIVWSNKII